ncbi:MAG TPA: hypothetical protein VGH38_28320 [Bryobacteraceae bacterium]|jgi:hypothetical protein
MTGKVFDMKCQEFWKTMPELRRGSGSTRDSGPLAHLRECSACAALWERQQSLAAGLRTVAAEWSHLEAPPRVEARLAAAFREHAGVGSPSISQVRRTHLWAPAIVWGTAAALAAVALFLAVPRQPKSARHNAPGAVEWAAVEPLSEMGTSGNSFYNNDDFIPLPNAARIAPNEDMNLVRVEVPRSAMIELGFLVSAERASEPVEAEVMLGSDGLARAVRFLD